MKKTILEIYALAVCFIVLICFGVTLGFVARNIIQITHPGFTLTSWEYQPFQTNDNYCVRLPTNSKTKCAGQNENEITKMREAAYVVALKNEQRTGLQSLVNGLIVLLINLIIFIPHWMIARKARA